MSIKKTLSWCFLLILLYNNQSWASSIKKEKQFLFKNEIVIGGYLQIVNVSSSTNQYSIRLHLDIDETLGTFEGTALNVKILRNRDNKEVRSISLSKKDFHDKSEEVDICNNIVGNTIRYINFEAEIDLNPSEYADSKGYYLQWTNCCRQVNIFTIENPGLSVLTLQTSFPALSSSSNPFINSTPTIGDLKNFLICENVSYEDQIIATDADGDELKFSLVTPLDASTPDFKVRWVNGFGLGNVVPGSPPLSINERTGRIIVNPDGGLYFFAVRVEEFRSGQKIGETIREFSLNTSFCVDKKIYVKEKPASEAYICDGESIVLNTKLIGDWTYQWVRDGQNIPGATDSSFKADKPGEYWVNVFHPFRCIEPTKLKTIIVKPMEGTFKLLVNGGINSCSQPNKAILFAPRNNQYAYKWYNGNNLLTDNGDSLIVTEPGKYRAVIEVIGKCSMLSDVIVFSTQSSKPLILETSGRNVLCPGDSLLLKVTNSESSNYKWFVNGKQIEGREPSRFVKAAGKYMVQTEEGGCTRKSNEIEILFANSQTAKFDMITSKCVSDDNPISLQATPPGGKFYGPGIKNNSFFPNLAGVGTHEINYVIEGERSCPSVTVKQSITVNDVPKLLIPSEVCVDRNMSTVVKIQNSENYLFDWNPIDGLDDPKSSSPKINIASNREYELTVSNAVGCIKQSKISVKICNEVSIPEAFTPNNDGINEFWEIKGIESYPNAEISIFNRWGTVIFYSKGYKKPFDGLSLMPGVYQYKIKLADGLPFRTGALLLIK